MRLFRQQIFCLSCICTLLLCQPAWSTDSLSTVDKYRWDILSEHLLTLLMGETQSVRKLLGPSNRAKISATSGPECLEYQLGGETKVRFASIAPYIDEITFTNDSPTYFRLDDNGTTFDPRSESTLVGKYAGGFSQTQQWPHLAQTVKSILSSKFEPTSPLIREITHLDKPASRLDISKKGRFRYKCSDNHVVDLSVDDGKCSAISFRVVNRSNFYAMHGVRH
jgi:hypothetical protein